MILAGAETEFCKKRRERNFHRRLHPERDSVQPKVNPVEPPEFIKKEGKNVSK